MTITFTGQVIMPAGAGRLTIDVIHPTTTMPVPQESDLIFHVDSSVQDSVTLSGSDITQINDLSPYGRHFSGSSVSLGGAIPDPNSVPPTLVSSGQNSRDIMAFNGERSLLHWNGTSTLIKHLFVVCKNNNALFDNFDGVLTSDTATNEIGLIGTSGNVNWISDLSLSTYHYNTTNISSGFPPNINTWAVHSISSPTGITSDNWVIGHDRRFELRGWDGEIAHMIAYGVQLGSTNRDLVINDLMNRWGIT